MNFNKLYIAFENKFDNVINNKEIFAYSYRCNNFLKELNIKKGFENLIFKN